MPQDIKNLITNIAQSMDKASQGKKTPNQPTGGNYGTQTVPQQPSTQTPQGSAR